MLSFGTFLLMQSPSARPSHEIYQRAIELAQAAEQLGFRNIWLAEHHFSTYGYLGRPVQLATYIAAKTTTLRVGTAVIVVPLHHPLIIAPFSYRGKYFTVPETTVFPQPVQKPHPPI